ncbi:HNH endonuclease family protein [Clostridium tanneri]|uniref:HNH endonuclease family protein n=1 Tax=Clostridium tanneri TaxID=3037988 RepID=UPI003D16C632
MEHILPESPNDQWKSIFNNDCDYYKYRIVNYTLLEKQINNEVGNETFNSKIEAYRSSSFRMTKKLVV